MASSCLNALKFISSFCLCLRGRHEGKLREENGGTVSRVRWMDNRMKATDAGDAGVARAVGDDRQWQMHYQRHLHSPLLADSHSVPHTQPHMHKHMRLS